MEEKKDWEQRIVDYSADLMDKHFPKGECKERGKALVFNAKLITYVMGELDRAREEVKKNIFTEEELRYLLEIIQLDYSLATMYQQREKSDIGGKLLRELSKLTTK